MRRRRRAWRAWRACASRRDVWRAAGERLRHGCARRVWVRLCEAATLRVLGCNPTCARLQPYVSQVRLCEATNVSLAASALRGRGARVKLGAAMRLWLVAIAMVRNSRSAATPMRCTLQARAPRLQPHA